MVWVCRVWRGRQVLATRRERYSRRYVSHPYSTDPKPLLCGMARQPNNSDNPCKVHMSPAAVPETRDEAELALAAVGKQTAQDYEQFRRMLSLPPTVDGAPSLISLPPTDAEAIATGAMVLAAYKAEMVRRSNAPVCSGTHIEQAGEFDHAVGTKTGSVTGAIQCSEDELDEEMEELDLDLVPGGMRDVTRSPQHHKLQMDNFVDDEEDEEEEEKETELATEKYTTHGAAGQLVEEVAAATGRGTDANLLPTSFLFSALPTKVHVLCKSAYPVVRHM